MCVLCFFEGMCVLCCMPKLFQSISSLTLCLSTLGHDLSWWCLLLLFFLYTVFDDLIHCVYHMYFSSCLVFIVFWRFNWGWFLLPQFLSKKVKKLVEKFHWKLASAIPQILPLVYASNDGSKLLPSKHGALFLLVSTNQAWLPIFPPLMG